MSRVVGEQVAVPLDIPQTELLAGTAITAIASADGYVSEYLAVVTTAVTTGGVLTLSVAGQNIGTVTVPNGATVGSKYSVKSAVGNPNRKVARGDIITVTPAAEFATAGAIKGTLSIKSSDI